MSAYDQAYAERWPTVSELERELGLLPPRRAYGRKKREPLPMLTEPEPCHHCNPRRVPRQVRMGPEMNPNVCVRCGTEWRPDYADQSLTDTPDGPVCVSRSNCDHRVKLRESLAKLRPVN